MKAYHYLLIIIALLAGWVLCNRKQNKRPTGLLYDNNTPSGELPSGKVRTIEELKALPQLALISYEEAKLFEPKEVSFDAVYTPELSYTISARQEFENEKLDIGCHIYIISKETADKLVKDGAKLYKYDNSRNGERYAEVTYEDALEIIEKSTEHISLGYDGGDGPEFEYSVNSNYKSGLCSRRAFAALFPYATEISWN